MSMQPLPSPIENGRCCRPGGEISPDAFRPFISLAADGFHSSPYGHESFQQSDIEARKSAVKMQVSDIGTPMYARRVIFRRDDIACRITRRDLPHICYSHSRSRSIKFRSSPSILRGRTTRDEVFFSSAKMPPRQGNVYAARTPRRRRNTTDSADVSRLGASGSHFRYHRPRASSAAEVKRHAARPRAAR